MEIKITACSREDYICKRNEIIAEMRNLMNIMSFPSFKIIFKMIPVDGFDRHGNLNMWI